jgi:hypothetical protein
MPCINTKRGRGRKKTSSGEAKKTIVYQVENTGMSTAKHQNPAEIGIEIQNTIGEQRREQENKTTQGA